MQFIVYLNEVALLNENIPCHHNSLYERVNGVLVQEIQLLGK